MNDIKIIDNFLEESYFIFLKNSIINNSFPWYFNDSIANENKENCNYELDNFYFTHNFYNNNLQNSTYFENFKNFLEILNVFSLIRCQANLYHRTEKKIFHDWHKDCFNSVNPNWTTAVYYLNSNNGNTILKNNEEDFFVDSIENRIVIFNSNTFHRSTTCTDKKYRCVINFNYYERS